MQNARKNSLPRIVGVEHRHDLRPLTEEQVRFEIDMCIGCDRCMRACPVPLSTSIDISVLNHASISDEVQPQVARFIDECVMCGSCVPVCPVDNHRDLLMLALKQRMGISWDGEVNVQRIFNYLPAGWDITRLLRHVREQPMFSDTELVVDNYLLHLLATSKILALPAGHVLLNEGEFGRSLYMVLEGLIELSTMGPDGESLPIAIIRRGEYLGEHGLLTGQPRNATARTLTSVLIVEVPEQVMTHLMEIVPALQVFFVTLNTVRSVEALLKRMALFQGIAEIDLRQLAQQAEVRRYERGEYVFGESGEERPAKEVLHLLLEGFVKVARSTKAGTGQNKGDERIIAYRQHGDYFLGGLDLLGDGGAVRVSAISRVGVVEIPRAVLTGLFTRYPQVNQRFQARAQQYADSAMAAQTQFFDPLKQSASASAQLLSDAEARAGLRALVDDGVVEGTEVLVIDLDKCIHCNECEEACARRHGHSRMNRKGMVVGNVSIATACRHCQDPVCMLCSRAGIARHPSGEVYITESCIGCGICAERCPYDNISIVSLEEEEVPANWQRFSAFFKGSGRKERVRKALPILKSSTTPGPLAQPISDGIEEMRKKIAIKCDLCAGYNNQACVHACPTGAAFRVRPETFFGSTENILRQRVR